MGQLTTCPGVSACAQLPRSVDFSALYDIIKVRYERTLDRAALMPALQLLWDRMEPSGTCRLLCVTIPPTGAVLRRGLGFLVALLVTACG